jgi:carbon storage regulator
MLVLTRKKNEKISIGKDVTITVVRINGDKVRIGIEAPENISVDRLEISESKKREIFFKNT